MKKLRLYTLLALLLMAGIVRMRAQITCWDGSIAEAYAGGDGTTGNPYQIATAEQLEVATLVTSSPIASASTVPKATRGNPLARRDLPLRVILMAISSPSRICT